MRLRHPFALLPVGLLLAAGLSGCGDDEAREAADVAATPDCTTSPTATAGVTDPDQTLCQGTPATFRANTPQGLGALELRVTSVEEDPDNIPAAFEAIRASGLDADEWTLVEVQVLVRVAAKDTSGGVVREGSVALEELVGQEWSIEFEDDVTGSLHFTPLPGCAQPTFDAGSDVGASAEGCIWSLTHTTAAATAVGFIDLLGSDPDEPGTAGTTLWNA